MTSLKRPVLALGAAALLTVSLTACGGGSSADAPKDTSKSSFCDSWKDMGSSIDDKASPDDQADQAHKVADKLKSVGTPSDMSSDARKGFEVFTDFLANVNGDDVKKLTADSSDSPWSSDEEKEVEAFLTYAGSCATGGTTIPSADSVTTPTMPTDMSMPTSMPTQ